MSEKFRWGILGTGSIARQFAEGLQALPQAEIAAVGSRKQGTADAFGEQFGATRCHGSYEALAADPEVDAIYIATPHPMHKSNTILCLEAGKHVLCEKPFAVNRAETEEMVAVARREKRFLMEAMWTRFLPSVCMVREWLAEGVIGDVRMFEGSFGFRADFDESHRLLDPNLAGGALLDVGIYPIAFAYMVFGGPPNRASSMATLGDTGVDEQSAYILGFPNGGLAVLSSAVRTESPQDACIMGTDGMIHIDSPFWRPTRITLTKGDEKKTVEIPYDATGYNYEAQHVADCVAAGKLESDIMPLDESLAIQGTMDEIRAQWGMRYPME